jgi:outer membrane protein TolC
MKKNVLVLCAAAALLTSCTVGPKYTKPALPAAPQFSEQPPDSYKETAGWKTTQPQDTQIRGKWWDLFGDPQLDALEEQVEPANQSLKVAEANFREAREQILVNRSNLYPTIDSGPSITHNRISSNTPSGLQGKQYGEFALPISVSYDADVWGRVRRTINAAREQMQASAADL